MLVICDPREMRHFADRSSLVLVPTMGALHAGHAELISRAGHAADRNGSLVAVSIFVNPLQFGDVADYENYPNTFDADLDLCRRQGVSVVYAPDTRRLYPDGFSTKVSVSGVSEHWEGESRSGHFDGVATVVTKLFAACRPSVAVFGRKDLQQVAVVRRLVLDLDLGVEIEVVPTVRDPDGLAISSRNVRLTAEGRRRALVLPRALIEGLGVARREGVPAARRRMADRIRDIDGVSLDYVDFVDDSTMESVESLAPGVSAIGAVVVDGVRLIDNHPFGTD